MSKRKICVVTGTRAEYGLLRWLMQDIRDNPQLELQIVATGTHLSPQFGLTYREIEADGFTIDAKVDMQLNGDSAGAVTRSLGAGVIGFADMFEQLQPDVLVVLGDRFEVLAAAQAAMLARVPIAHIHGGESTEGLIDEAIRHSVTKMSHLHFVTAEPYRKRVLQMGEAADRIWNFGAPGLDALNRVKLLTRDELSRSAEFDLTLPYLIVTYHPVTLSEDETRDEAEALFSALQEFKNHQVLLTGVNADPGHDVVAALSAAFAQANPARVRLCTSLGQQRYLSALRYADAVVGNSSSALIEAPAFALPAVNIGDRQRGRLRQANLIDASGDRESIAAAIHKALTPEFRQQCREAGSSLGDGHASEQIARVLAEHPLDGILKKKFREMA